jgi:hypothetical protein
VLRGKSYRGGRTRTGGFTAEVSGSGHEPSIGLITRVDSVVGIGVGGDGEEPDRQPYQVMRTV